jgi:hypothetical protein
MALQCMDEVSVLHLAEQDFHITGSRRGHLAFLSHLLHSIASARLGFTA